MLSNYADDNKLFSIRKYINEKKDALAKLFGIVNNWFYGFISLFQILENAILCILTEKGENETFTFGDACHNTSKEKVILGITINNKLNFDSHIRKIFEKSGQKLDTL